MRIRINDKNNPYDIILERGISFHLKDCIDVEKRTVIVTDKKIPLEYVFSINEQIKNSIIYIAPSGEKTKSIQEYMKFMLFLEKHKITRKDRIISLGGGVIGDFAGFVASTYKRGIEWINIPTTTLSMIDSSIGGKTALNLNNTKNIIGSFYNPKLVIIDINFTRTLPKRHYYAGLVEALKASMIANEKLFELFLKDSIKNSDLEEIIYQSLQIKKNVVEKDPYEENIRKCLNYGHTFGHAYEAYGKCKKYLHGEAVGIGIYLLSQNKPYFNKVLKALNDLKVPLNKIGNENPEVIMEYIKNDKKISSENNIDLVEVNRIGSYEIKSTNLEILKEYLKKAVK